LLLHQIGITLIPGVGDINGRKLISHCGGVEAVFKEKKQALLKIPGIGISTVNSIISQSVLKRAEEEITFIEKYGITPLFYLDKLYPRRLNHCADAPLMVYYKGNANLNSEKVVSIVGTRRATDYGRRVCNEIVEELASLDVLVVSGLAYGIDTCSHKAALKNNLDTIGILAHGLDRLYPADNRELAKKMKNKGGLLTEFLSNTTPDRENFPKRNRIVAGLADAVIVIESAARGGALITAGIANSYNRDVFAIPGKLHSKYSEGCNMLIKTNRAALIQSAADVILMMQWQPESRKPAKQRKLFVELSPDQEKIMEILKENEDTHIDTIVMKSDFTGSKIAAILLNLEFEGVVSSLPGKMYRLN
jgi:DNA processing protein